MAANLPKAEILVLESSNREPHRAKDAAAVATKGETAIAEWLRAIGGKVQMADGQVTAVSLNGTTDDRQRTRGADEAAAAGRVAPAAHRDQPDWTGAAREGALAANAWILATRCSATTRCRCLASLTNLRALDLPSTLVEGTGPRRAGGAAEPSRARSRAARRSANDGASSSWRRLTGLESLNLRHTDITDPGMAHFAALKNLKRLDLTSVDITEKGLEGLAR